MVTENSEASSAEGHDSSLAGQFLSALQFSQDFTLKFVNAWFDGAGEVVAKLTDLAVSPEKDAPQPPSDLFTFVQQLFQAQQSFIDEMTSKADPVSFMGSLQSAQTSLLAKPSDVAAANLRLTIGLDAAVKATLARAAGTAGSAPIAPSSGD